jgi:nicotinamide-nucleotide amidase
MADPVPKGSDSRQRDLAGEDPAVAELVLALADALRQRRWTLATAESCTGGLVGSLITQVPGSSAYYVGGVVSYADSAKVALLGVPRDLLAAHGAVSAPVAEAMARGVRTKLAADLALSITGVAGPGGGSAEKPVGLVYIGLATVESVASRRLMLSGDRRAVRLGAAQAALAWAVIAAGSDDAP